ncbi:MAG: type II and III secretion system protein [Elusimicrobiales bacterium]|nr:type II and III secretion system protein [Elusimicrobiales bacterium]
MAQNLYKGDFQTGLRRGQRTALLLLILLFPAGCRTGTLKEDKELTALLSDLTKRNQEILAGKRERQEKEFRAFRVTRSGAGIKVSMDLVDAPADVAFLRLMSEAGTPFRMGDVTLPGRVSVKADEVPLLDAVRLVTEPLGVAPQMRGDTLFLNYAPTPLADPAEASTQTVTRSFVLRYLTPDSALNLLNELFPAPKPLNFTKVTDLRSIYMSGPEGAVQRAIDLLMRADRDPGAVQIEAIIVSVNAGAYEEFNSQFSGITKGRISGGKINVWALQDTSLEFTYNQSPAVKNPLAFTALMNMLFQQQKARVIARPFITAMSGEEAEMKIGQNRYVVVQQVASGAAVYGTQAIESGVGFKITPMVLGENMIRLNIDMTNRQFLPTQGNVDQIIENSSARTILTLEDGQTAIIGGLKMKSVSTANSGIPWLRRIPLLNLLTAAHEEDQSGQEVFFYLTPHIVRPGMEGPRDRPEAFSVSNDLLTPIEKLQR